MTKLLTLIAIGLLAAGGSAIAQNGANGTWEEYCGVFTNPCCEQEIAFCVQIHTVERGNGYHINIQGSGEGEDGTRYVIMQNQNVHLNANENGGLNDSYIVTLRANATHGSDCGMLMTIRAHFTMNANGEVTVDRWEYDAECENGSID